MYVITNKNVLIFDWMGMLYVEGESLAVNFCIYHPIKYQHILISNNVYVCMYVCMYF
jgi:hypothetical protein